jgi:hypothetical protein
VEATQNAATEQRNRITDRRVIEAARIDTVVFAEPGFAR